MGCTEWVPFPLPDDTEQNIQNAMHLFFFYSDNGQQWIMSKENTPITILNHCHKPSEPSTNGIPFSMIVLNQTTLNFCPIELLGPNSRHSAEFTTEAP
jgi:hypothetical protein